MAFGADAAHPGIGPQPFWRRASAKHPLPGDSLMPRTTRLQAGWPVFRRAYPLKGHRSRTHGLSMYRNCEDTCRLVDGFRPDAWLGTHLTGHRDGPAVPLPAPPAPLPFVV